ncbi:MAG: lipase family protein [Alphaproteobacteria bacterium]|nr:MAG: lipase family protein [Alphaproteobacteria bacterium]
MNALAHFDAPELLSPPIKRAAYSDRTAWLMAEMSRLAYDKFEGSRSLKSLAEGLAKCAGDKKKIVLLLKEYIDNVGTSAADARQELIEQLAKAKFSLENIYNAQGTQAFLAKLDASEGAEPMLILALRGTEAELADIKADLKVDLITVSGEQKVHHGFYDAFNAVKSDIEDDLAKHRGVPIYVTGHSLGGALAILATKYLASDSLGACYTFGGPRVGNSLFADDIKTPIYRIVNAADGVPRVPPSWGVDVFLAVLKWLPLPMDAVIAFLKKFRGYVHYGDMRYLTHTPQTPDANGVPYNGLRLLPNPSLPLRLTWAVRRWVATWGKAAVQDHSVVIYCEKLMAYAKRRNR